MAGNQAVAVRGQQAELSAYERALVFGDITGLDEAGRKAYLEAMCASLNLDPATRPFGYMSQWAPGGDRLVFYLTATGAAQLRLQHAISITRVEDNGPVPDGKGDCYRWTVYGRLPNGREDVEVGSKPLYKQKDGTPLIGLDYENARKAALTQAKTRLTKSLTGLAGVLSEDEVDVPVSHTSARPMVQTNGHTVNTDTGEVTPAPKRHLDPKAPLAARGYEVLRGLARKLHALDPSQELVDVPDGLTNEDAVELQVRLAEWIEAAEARGTPEEVLPT